MNQKILAGNWKMNHDFEESVRLTQAICDLTTKKEKTNIILFPPSIFIPQVFAAAIGLNPNISIGCQNVHFETNGAYTGEVSTSMIQTFCKYVIVGHSERRQYFKEKSSILLKKLKSVLSAKMTPILCIGESLKQRESGETFEVLNNQIKETLFELNNIEAKKCIVAYEPIWAIGTGLSATASQVEEVHNFLHNLITEKIGESIPLLYGGSCKPENCKELLSINYVDGALVGGASLKADSFVKMIEIAENI